MHLYSSGWLNFSDMYICTKCKACTYSYVIHSVHVFFMASTVGSLTDAWYRKCQTTKCSWQSTSFSSIGDQTMCIISCIGSQIFYFGTEWVWKTEMQHMDHSVQGGKVFQWLLAMMDKWSLKDKRLYVSECQLLKGDCKRWVLPSYPSCGIPGNFWLATIRLQDAGLNGPSVWSSSAHFVFLQKSPNQSALYATQSMHYLLWSIPACSSILVAYTQWYVWFVILCDTSSGREWQYSDSDLKDMTGDWEVNFTNRR